MLLAQSSSEHLCDGIGTAECFEAIESKAMTFILVPNVTHADGSG